MNEIESLIARLQSLIDAATGNLEANLSPTQIQEYHEIMEELLSRYHLAAYMTGAGTVEISAEARGKVIEGVAVQLAFLDNFITEIEDTEEFKAGWENRARQYATSIKVPYWEGKVKLLPLPAMPGDFTTECGQGCKCSWDIKKVGKDRYEAYWTLHPAEHCQGCLERSRQWNPLVVDNGVLLSE